MIWSDQAGLQGGMPRRPRGSPSKLAEAAKGGDAQATLAAFAALGKDGCGGCHETFRKKTVLSQLRMRRAAALLALAALLAAPAAARADAGRARARRAAVPHRRLHQLPHRQERRAAGRRRRRSSSPFGDFYAPNITPDPETGIGGWTLEQFIRAMREGRDPEGWPLYPAFPYTSYTRMTDEDLAALKAYLDTLPAVSQASKPHDLWFPFNLRWGLYLWQWLFFTPERFAARPGQGRGLEPRRLSGAGARPLRRVPHAAHLLRRAGVGPRRSRARSSARRRCRTSRPNPAHGLGKWSAGDLGTFLKLGMTPGRRLRRLRDGQGGQQRHQQAAGRRHRGDRRLSARACRPLEA